MSWPDRRCCDAMPPNAVAGPAFHSCPAPGRGYRKMTDWTSLRYVVVDVEGNGHQPPDLVELATLPIVSGVMGEPTNWIVRPDQEITPFARKLHGIANEDVADAPVFADIKDEVLRALDGAVLVAHNAHVDVGVLQRKLGDWECPEVFDTLKLARRLLPGLGSYKLSSLIERFKLAEDMGYELTPHRANCDAIVTARLFVRLANLPDTRPLSLEELRGDSSGRGGDETPSLF